MDKQATKHPNGTAIAPEFMLMKRDRGRKKTKEQGTKSSGAQMKLTSEREFLIC